MQCRGTLISSLSWTTVLLGLAHMACHRRPHTPYGRYSGRYPPGRSVPARLSWFLQELPALLMPALLLLLDLDRTATVGGLLLLGTFCLHYFQRTFVYSLVSRGQPYPLGLMMEGGFFCALNGFLQGHYLLHCAHYDDGWWTDCRCKTGLALFYCGMAINVHSDYILRNLRTPGEVVYKIPTGGLFEYVSCANYFGEIVEWFGFALATWSLPALTFAIFSLCYLGPRAHQHHRFYQEKFNDYPRLRKALVPFVF